MLKRPNPLEKSPLWPKTVTEKPVDPPSSYKPDGLQIFLSAIFVIVGLLFLISSGASAENKIWLFSIGVGLCFFPCLFAIRAVYGIFISLLICILGIGLIWTSAAGLTLNDVLFAVMGCSIFALAMRLGPDNPGCLTIVVLAAVLGTAEALLESNNAMLLAFGIAILLYGGVKLWGDINGILRLEEDEPVISSPDQEKSEGGKGGWITGAFAVALIGAALAWAILDEDSDPNAYVAEVITFPLNIRAPISKLCINDNTVPELRALRVIATRERFPKAALQYDITLTGEGSVLLPFEMKEVLWESAARYHSTAIPAGAKIVFEGRCTGVNQFKWSLHRSTTVSASLLPEFGGEFAVGN